METAVRRFDALVYKQVESTRDYYKQYKQAAQNTGGDTRMSHIEFSEAVGDAMRNGDQHAVPQVAEAARAIRPIVEQTKITLVELGILRGCKKSPQQKAIFRVFII